MAPFHIKPIDQPPDHFAAFLRGGLFMQQLHDLASAVARLARAESFEENADCIMFIDAAAALLVLIRRGMLNNDHTLTELALRGTAPGAAEAKEELRQRFFTPPYTAAADGSLTLRDLEVLFDHFTQISLKNIAATLDLPKKQVFNVRTDQAIKISSLVADALKKTGLKTVNITALPLPQAELRQIIKKALQLLASFGIGIGESKEFHSRPLRVSAVPPQFAKPVLRVNRTAERAEIVITRRYH